MNHFHTSTGQRIKKSTIDGKVRQAKFEVLDKQDKEFGFNFCMDCGKNEMNTRIDCSHNLSVDYCQKNGCVELAWSKDNIKIRCRECHQKRDKLNLQFVINNKD